MKPIDPEKLVETYLENAPETLAEISANVVTTVDVLADASEGKRIELETIEPDPGFIDSFEDDPREVGMLWKVAFNTELTKRGTLVCRQRGKTRWYWTPNNP